MSVQTIKKHTYNTGNANLDEMIRHLVQKAGGSPNQDLLEEMIVTALKMREDELALLESVRKFFGCGRISFQKEYRQNQRDNYRYQVSNLKDLSTVIIPFFEKNILYSTPRRKDFNLFRQIVALVNSKAHKTNEGFALIQQLKAQLHM